MKLPFAKHQPRPLLNQHCHLNAFWWANEYGLQFAWCLFTTGANKFVHAVCLDTNLDIVDPTLGDWAIETTTAIEMLPDAKAPTSYEEANTMLTALKLKYEPQRRWWEFWKDKD